MIKIANVVFFIASLLVSSGSVEARDKSSIDALTRGTERPTIQEVSQFPVEVVRSNLGDPLALTARDQTVYKLYELMVQELRHKYSDSLIMIFGRDGEEFYDAYMAMASREEASRIKLFDASRPLSRNSSDRALMVYMQAHGMRINDIIAGRQKVVWIDSGSRGSIYITLLAVLIRQVPDTDPQRSQKLRNIFNMISPKLIVAWGHPTAANFADTLIAHGTTNADLIGTMFSQLYFEQIPRNGRAEFGIDGDDASKRRWVVDHIEHIPKWGPRTQLVRDSGVVEYEAPEPHINKPAYFLNQAKVAQHFARLRSGARTSPVVADDDEDEEIEERTHRRPVVISLPAGVSMDDFAALIKIVRESESGEVRDAALQRVLVMTKDPELYPLIITNFADSARFAHIVHKFTELFNRKFLQAYYTFIKAKGSSDGAHLRMMRSCEILFGK